jgi:hypothetical protein
METKKREIREARNRQDVLIGFIASMVFVVFAWGIDTYQLFTSNYILPWIKLAIGVIPVVAIITGTTWLGTKLNHIVVKTLLWMAAATVLSLIISTISFKGAETVYKFFLPEIADRLSYLATEGIESRLFIVIVMTNILFILGGLLIDSASQAVITASGMFGWVFSVLFCLAFFAGAGFTADSNFNTELRENVIAIDEQIEFVSQLDLEDLTEGEQRMIRRFTRLEVDLQSPRRLLVATFDESFSQTQVLINFDGTWTQCLSLNGRVGTCQRFEE